MSKKRIIRSTTVAELETMYNVPEGTIRKLSGANARGDMKLSTLAWSLIQSLVTKLETVSNTP